MIKTWRVAMVFVTIAMSAAGCATAFTGNAHVEGGRKGCEAKCRSEGMSFAGMVYMGEYSSACLCSDPGRPPGSTPPVVSQGAASAAAAAGWAVTTQRAYAPQ